MTKFKKIIPALCMLLISAVLMGTSTYAWFSMNTTVTATGLSVTAKSNAAYLLISDAENKNGSNTESLSETVAASYANTETNADKKVYPVTFFSNATAETAIGNIKLSETQNYSEATWIGANKWFTANNSNSGNANDSVKNVVLVTEGTTNYMLEYNVWLTLSKDSEAVNNQKVKVTLKSHTGDAAAKAVVVIGTDHFALGADNAEGTTTNAVALTNSTTVKVTVYVYIDGESANVNSDYVNGGKTVNGAFSLQFDLVD